MVFENVPMGRVAAAAVAEQQHTGGARKGGRSEGIPPVGETVTSEPTGVVAHAEIDVAKVSLAVVDAVRMQDSRGGAGEIMVESLAGLLRVQAAGPIQKAQEFLVFTVDTQNRIRRILVRGSITGDDLKLPIALGVPAQREAFLSLASAQMVALEELGHHGDADGKASIAEFLGNPGARAVGPQYSFALGIARQVLLDDLQESGVEIGAQAQAGLSAAPFFRERPGGNQGPSSSSRSPRRMVLRSQSKS